MQLSDIALGQGIIQEIDFNCDTDATLFPVAQKVRSVNRWYDKAVSIILDSDGRWQFDDTNATDLPIATTTLVSGQQDYTLDTTFLRILRVEVLNVNGIWTKLDPLDQADIYNQGLVEFLKTAGLPKFYDVQGQSIFLYPKPDAGISVTLAAGLKVYTQRNVSYFVAGDTTKVPGFASLYHRYLALGPSYDWCVKKQLPQKNDIKAQLDTMEEDMRNFFSTRNKDEKIQLRAKKHSFR